MKTFEFIYCAHCSSLVRIVHENEWVCGDCMGGDFKWYRTEATDLETAWNDALQFFAREFAR